MKFFVKFEINGISKEKLVYHLLKKNYKKMGVTMSEKKYTKDHEWVSIDNDIATVGISNLCSRKFSDIVFIELPSVGKTVNAKDEIRVVESVKAASDIYAPIDGEIMEVNNSLEGDAAIINQDAENTGWIFENESIKS